MSLTFTDLGFWKPYSSDTETVPGLSLAPGMKVLFARQEGTDLDWYGYLTELVAEWPVGGLLMTMTREADDSLTVQGVFRDPTMAFPSNMRVFIVEGHDVDDPKPWKAFEQKVYDPVAQTFAERATPVPGSCSKLGLKRALAEIGEWETVRGALATNPDLYEDWELATEIKRTDPLVQAMIAQRGYTDAQVDQLLVRANALVN